MLKQTGVLPLNRCHITLPALCEPDQVWLQYLNAAPQLLNAALQLLNARAQCLNAAAQLLNAAPQLFNAAAQFLRTRPDNASATAQLSKLSTQHARLDHYRFIQASSKFGVSGHLVSTLGSIVKVCRGVPISMPWSARARRTRRRNSRPTAHCWAGLV
jgi:hypothetical protein